VLNENDIDSTSYAIARYLLDNYSRIGEVGIEEIMQACFVSRSGVRRSTAQSASRISLTHAATRTSNARLKRLYCGYASDTSYGYSLAELVAESLANVDQLLYDGKIDELAQLIHDSREVIIVASGCRAAVWQTSRLP
jgi:DNA-binding MurR/RpiR family transcriptional regulator